MLFAYVAFNGMLGTSGLTLMASNQTLGKSGLTFKSFT